MKVRIENKKIETIRVNEELALLLEEVPKGISYANWLLDKLKRLKTHEDNAICWIESTSNIGSNRMSVGDENGKHPVFDETIEIVFEVPRTNMSKEEREAGWLGSSNEYSSYAHGGFASVESAKTYIIEQLGGRLIEDAELLKTEYSYDYDEDIEKYTTAKYDQYEFVDHWFSVDEPDVEGLTDEQIQKLAEDEEKKANEEGMGLLDDVDEYLMKLRDSK